MYNIWTVNYQNMFQRTTKPPFRAPFFHLKSCHAMPMAFVGWLQFGVIDPPGKNGAFIGNIAYSNGG